MSSKTYQEATHCSSYNSSQCGKRLQRSKITKVQPLEANLELGSHDAIGSLISSAAIDIPMTMRFPRNGFRAHDKFHFSPKMIK